MNQRPLNPITQQMIDDYAEHGVVCLRGMFDQDWIERILEAWSRISYDIEHLDISPLRVPKRFVDQDPILKAEIDDWYSPENIRKTFKTGSYGMKFMRLWDADFYAFVKESPAAEIAGRVMGANEVRFFWDQMFCKAPKNGERTYWHTDYPSWPVKGEMMPSLWLNFLPLKKENCLEFVSGSHRWGGDEKVWPGGHAATALGMPADRVWFRDIEAERKTSDFEILSWNLEPGDALLIHPSCYHGNGGNKHPTRPRIALSTRWAGTDLTWDPKPEASTIAGLPVKDIKRGEPFGNVNGLFPLVWKRPVEEQIAA